MCVCFPLVGWFTVAFYTVPVHFMLKKKQYFEPRIQLLRDSLLWLWLLPRGSRLNPCRLYVDLLILPVSEVAGSDGSQNRADTHG